MNSPSVLITGAAGSLGRSFVKSLANQRPDFHFELADLEREEASLRAIADNTRCSSAKLIMGDMFTKGTPANAATTTSDARIVIWNAAVNLDNIDREKRKPLRDAQNACLEARIATLCTSESDEVRRLLVVVCSITAIHGQELEFAKAAAEQRDWQYELMKGDQHVILRNARPALKEAGVDLMVLYPGSFDSNFTNQEEALRLANSVGRKVRGYNERENLKQERILNPREITDPVARQIVRWQNGEDIPDDAEHGYRNSHREWIMLNLNDLDA